MVERWNRWRWVVACAAELGAAVWIRGPGGRLRYLNPRAEALLRRSSADLLGQPCHRAIAARDTQGQPFCAPNCPVLRLARQRAEIAPVDLRIDRPGNSTHWLRVLFLPFASADLRDPYVVHCALCSDADFRIRDFMQRIAARSSHVTSDGIEVLAVGGPPVGVALHGVGALTPREREILDLLAEDRNLHEIAARLHVSYITIRNHVQHVLTKLGAHSILEAVAVYLVANDE